MFRTFPVIIGFSLLGISTTVRIRFNSVIKNTNLCMQGAPYPPACIEYILSAEDTNCAMYGATTVEDDPCSISYASICESMF